MTICIHQPNFLPYLGYFYKIYQSDIFVILDNVQYTKNSFINRSKIKTQAGKQWLTVPVIKGSKQLINEVKLSDYKVHSRKILNTIQQNYSRTPEFSKLYLELEEIFKKEHEFLIDLNCELIRWVLRKMCFYREVRLSSRLKDVTGTSTIRLINIIRALDGDEYYSGTGAGSYQEELMYKQYGITLTRSDFIRKYSKYQDVSILNLIFNHEELRKTIFR